MAFDGITTAALRNELASQLQGGRINKIAQTEADELILTIRRTAECGGGQVRLFMSANPSLPLVYLIDENRPSPMTAPAFCMLLRKHLQGGKILSITQPGLERILNIEIEHLNEMGDLCTHTLIIELMGKHSNIIFIDENQKIIDSIRRVSAAVSSVREVLPGRDYFIPETQNKRSPFDESPEQFAQTFLQSASSPAKTFVSNYTGFSTLISEELCARAHLVHDRSASSMSSDDLNALRKEFYSLLEDIQNARFYPVIYYKQAERGIVVPAEFSACRLQICEDMKETPFESVSALLQTYYAEKNTVTRIRQKSADLRHIVQTILERDIHKYDLQRKQIRDAEKRDKYRIYGELLNAFGYDIPEGASSCVLRNYYTDEDVKITLDPTKTPAQNAKKYFDRYTKLKRTSEALTTLTANVKAEIDQLQVIRSALDMAVTEGDLAQIRAEMEQSGFIRRHPADKKKGKSRTLASKPLHYVSSDGYDIYVGRNNLQNDEITFKLANGSDLWFHANDMPGSHVIVRTGGKHLEEVPDLVFEEAASLAAYYSSGREQEKVEIDYLERKGVKKPSGGRPGFVVYYNNYSILAGTDISGIKEVTD